MKILVLFNPKSGNGRAEKDVRRLDTLYPDDEIVYSDITAIPDIVSFMGEEPADEKIIICGGDGTVNHLINDFGGKVPEHDLYFCAAGTGNDFMNDLGLPKDAEPFLLNPYMKDLPSATINGKKYYFINGIGFGIDGYCCEVGDKIRATSDKEVNYTSIAIKGLLFGFHRTNAEVTVDGVTEKLKHIWLVPTMKGRYYGGGMIAAPTQSRSDPEHKVTVMSMAYWSKIATLIAFPSIFKGTHVNHKKIVKTWSGHNVTVKFDRPTALQVDGETISGVTEYSVSTGFGQN